VFDYATSKPQSIGASPWSSRLVSALAHAAVVVAIAVAALDASETLPEPKQVLAFVAEPAPPPPPPAPAVEPEKPRPAAEARPTQAPRRAAVTPDVAPVAAPIEAPSGIRPETGREGSAVSAGFESEYGIPGGIPGGVAGGVVGGEGLVPPPPPPSTPVRVGGSITAPKLVKRVAPRYPLIAEHAQVQGVVILEATVNERGRVEAVQVLRGHPLLEEAAIEAVKQWQYEPLMLNGRPHPFVLTVTVNFSIT
jgi:protein TonB